MGLLSKRGRRRGAATQSCSVTRARSNWCPDSMCGFGGRGGSPPQTRRYLTSGIIAPATEVNRSHEITAGTLPASKPSCPSFPTPLPGLSR